MNPAQAPTPIDRIPFLRLLGMHQDDAPPGQSVVRLAELRPEHCNLLPAAHGGVVMTLLDVAMARAASSRSDAPSTSVVTVEMSSRFLRPARGALIATGRVVHGGGSLCTCQAEVHQADGTLVASAMGTFKYWKAPLGGIE
jgi:uncharacterized protein (TIGR00369 family)